MKYIEILPDGTEIEDRLHPIYKYEFKNNIIGRTNMIKKVLLILNRKPEAWVYLDKPFNARNREAIKKIPVIKLPYYWELIRLIVADRILADKELVNWIKDLNDETEFRIMNMIKRGVMKSYTPERRYGKLNYIYNDIRNIISDVFEDIEDVTKLTADEYKSLKNQVKETVFENIKFEGNLLSGIVPDEKFDKDKFKEDYLK